MAAPGVYDPIQTAFDNAVREFRKNIKDDNIYRQILAIKTIDDVYDATDKLQKEQSANGHMRHLTKIQPFLENLRGYAGVIEVLLQAKPDILALIWGPIKLLLEWTSILKQSFDSIVNTTRDIGSLLPEFSTMAKLFKDSLHIKDVLLLFFKDMLDFYSIALKFFSMKRWQLVFEPMWPRHRDKIKVVMDNVERHAMLFRNEVRLEHIQEEHQARIRALEHFEKAEISHRRQEFDAIRANISPMSYDGKLDWLCGRRCPGTQKWLLNNGFFRKWLDANEADSNLFWLQGIPGAGKTFLSSFIISETAAISHTVYAFLSYTQADRLSALTVLQSLLFQLSSRHEDLRDAVCQTNANTIKSDIDSVGDIFVKLCSYVQPIYIVVDGLDEMERVERCRLLQRLVHIASQCQQIRILISSRFECDIDALMNSKASVRIDNQNAESIQTFITERTKEWFAERSFLIAAQIEIQNMLKPIASKAKGMFMYAKIVLQNVSELDGLDEIRSELRALPEDLNDAYARILVRISNLRPLAKEKAQTVLGWIAATPTLMTVQELEKALSVERGQAQSTSTESSILNIAKNCGPILEIVDNYVQFNHFTVKEYFFSPNIQGSLDLNEATLSLALCFVKYLTSAVFDINHSDEEIASNVISGEYALYNLASTSWFSVVEAWLQMIHKTELPTRLVEALDDFATICRDAGNFSEPDGAACPHLSALSSASPAITWAHLDPTPLATLSASIYDLSEQLLDCKSTQHTDCRCPTIERYYGLRKFRCTMITCPFYRYGFESKSRRNTHMKTHTKPWRCGIPGCEFVTGGFFSRRMRDDHLKMFHGSRPSEATQQSQPFDLDNVYPILLDLVKLNRLEEVKSILNDLAQHPGSPLKLKVGRKPNLLMSAALHVSRPATSVFLGVFEIMGEDEDGILEIEKSQTLDMLLWTAAQYASPQLLKELMKRFDYTTVLSSPMQTLFYYVAVLLAGLKTRNVAVCKCLMEDIRDVYRRIGHDSLTYDWKVLAALVSAKILETDSEELWNSWCDSLLVGYLTRSSSAGFDWREVFAAARKNVHRQHTLILLSKELLQRVPNRWEQLLTSMLKGAMLSGGCSQLVEYLLNDGADANHRDSLRSLTSLQLSARRDSREDAEITRLLLYHGARPDITVAGSKTRIENEKEPKASRSGWA